MISYAHTIIYTYKVGSSELRGKEKSPVFLPSSIFFKVARYIFKQPLCGYWLRSRKFLFFRFSYSKITFFKTWYTKILQNLTLIQKDVLQQPQLKLHWTRTCAENYPLLLRSRLISLPHLEGSREISKKGNFEPFTQGPRTTI